MIGYDNNDADDGHTEYNRLITEEQAQQVHVIRDNYNNKVTPNVANAHNAYMTHVRTHLAKRSIRKEKEEQQQSNRTREQQVNSILVLL